MQTASRGSRLRPDLILALWSYDGIPCSENEHRRPKASFSESRQNLQTVATGKHDIQNHQVEFLRVHQVEPLFLRWAR